MGNLWLMVVCGHTLWTKTCASVKLDHFPKRKSQEHLKNQQFEIDQIEFTAHGFI